MCTHPLYVFLSTEKQKIIAYNEILQLVFFESTILQRMSSVLRERTTNYSRLHMHFVIAVAVWYALGGSQDEVRCANQIIAIIVDQFVLFVEQALKVRCFLKCFSADVDLFRMV